MNTSDRIKKTHVSIMRHPEFCLFSGVLACGDVEITEEAGTACTDGWNVRYAPSFVDPLSDSELRFLVLHEAVHKAYKHTFVYKSLFRENPKLAGVAADYVVNTMLYEADPKASFIKFIEGGVPPEPKFSGWSVKQVYDHLKQEQQEQQGGGGSGPQSIDGHELTDEAGEGAPTPEELEQRANEIARALRHGEVVRKNLKRGTGSANDDGKFGDLLRPEIDWRQVLREFVQETCSGRDESSWRRPSRRFLSDDIYLPSMISERLNHLVVGIDTSGSCFGTSTMTRFVTELTTIIEQMRPARTTVVYWGSAVCAHQEFEEGQFAVADLKPRGGGGTDGSVLFDWLRAQKLNPTAVVQFTDGYVGSFGESDWPTLWAITSKHIKATHGTSLYIND